MSLLGIFLTLTGVILATIGGILLYIYRNDKPKPWWIWGLIVAGGILFLLGILAYFLIPTTVSTIVEDQTFPFSATSVQRTYIQEDSPLE